ncbi:RNA methyltransferase, TrmH family [Cnuella takakiae]|uniref:RNA methyltransferase, TrmH family n=1 Tax=Cnuella takakiae TaxID=1302690 RepID=A0A1M4YBZ9_9BACT|nr:RNA methyltransferase [Cnuella takakiae]OLY93105.1 hypothetical protein BUE76_15300 [Cnuella takakiae]SHF03199.1 RNA methyltransferase, TrmH family [Cnuella takakiae]
MLSNKVVKDIQSLSDKKHRDEARLFVAEGPKIVAEMIAAAAFQIEAIYALPAWAEANATQFQGLPLTIVDERMLQRLSNLQTPNQVLAIMRQFPSQAPNDIEGWVLYLDTIQDPGNMGTIIRLADWFAISHIVCTPGCADPYNNKVVQSTMASLARVNIWVDKTGSWIGEQQLPVWAAALNGQSLYEVAVPSTGILMIGNESKGLGPGLMERATQKITIPRKGKAESLNAAVATGIILSHLNLH